MQMNDEVKAKVKVKDVLKEGFSVPGEIEKDISMIVCDSRDVKGGELFVAIKGEHFDGHDFIEDAIKKGAVAIVYELQRKRDERHWHDSLFIDKYPHIVWIGVEDCRDTIAAMSSKFYGSPSEEVTTIGITGTNGKTTTSYLIKSVMEKWGHNVGLIGTIAYLIKDKAYYASHTTPVAPVFQSLLREMANEGCSHVVAEVSSHSLSQRRVYYTGFKIAVFTNLTREHLDFHKTMENYFMAKTRLFTDLLSEGGTAIVNIDNPYGVTLVDILKRQRGNEIKILTLSIESNEANLVASNIKTTYKGTTFKVRFKGQTPVEQFGLFEEEIFSPLIGIFNVYNILSAISASLSLGIPIKTIKSGIATAELIKGRFEKVDLGQDFLAIVDYAHTDDALKGLLLTAHQLIGCHRLNEKLDNDMVDRRGKDGKIIIVFGCGGNRDEGKRSKMGEIATRLSDLAIITTDNPRDELPDEIIRDIEVGIEGDNYIVVPDRNVAINMAVELASDNDIVLVAGKGHEDYQEIKGIRYNFSDREVLEDAVRRRTKKSP